MKKTLDYVDLGLPSGVLWASKNATVEDKSMPHDAGEKSFYCQHLFDYDEAKRFFKTLLPNPAEFQELYDLCEWKWLKRKRAYKVTGPNGNSILLQAEGLAYKGLGFNRNGDGWEGFYWSSKSCGANAYCLVLNDVDYNPQWNADKTTSFSVRLVKRTNHMSTTHD